jgi:hypothetical protein
MAAEPGAHLVGVGPHGDAKGACQAEVRQLEGVARAVNEQVLGLEVPVQDTARGVVLAQFRH